MNIKKIKKIVISTVVLISIAAVGTWLSILYIENKEIKQTKREREEKLQIINTSIQFVGGEAVLGERYDSKIVTLEFKNTSQKNITGIRGEVRLLDNFGDAYNISAETRSNTELPFEKQGNYGAGETFLYIVELNYSNRINLNIENISTWDVNITDIVFDDGERINLYD